MDVTRDCFLRVLPVIENAIENCDFAAVDTELSGLYTNHGVYNIFDTIEERYDKLRSNAMGHAVIQLGLSCFSRQSNTGDECKYDCKSFNFYVFPYKTNASVKSWEKICSVQPSALSFLAGHGFDFNKLIREGITWLTIDEETSFLEAFERKRSLNDHANALNTPIEPNSNPKLASIPSDHKHFIENVVYQLNQFILNPSEKTLKLEACSAFRRKLIYEVLEASPHNEYLDITSVISTDNSRERHLLLNKVTAQEKEKKTEDLITETVGMLRVIKCLVKNKKLLVGHNLLLDIMHITNQFVGPLPNNFQEFKLLLSELFPVLFDTKQIASSTNVKELIPNSSLEEVYAAVKKPPFKQIEVNVHADNAMRMHQAGYDSFVTGYCFIVLSEFLKTDIDKFRNKLNITYINDITFIHLEGENVTPKRNHVFHVTFPDSWKASDLIQMFSVFGNITIGWINDVSAFVALKDPSKASDARKAFDDSHYTGCKVQCYYDFVTNHKRTIEQPKRKVFSEPRCASKTKKPKVEDTDTVETDW